MPKNFCRYCRVAEDSLGGGNLLEPCACTGDRRYAHARCLNLRREIPLEAGAGENSLECHVCGEQLASYNDNVEIEEAPPAQPNGSVQRTLASYAGRAADGIVVGASYYATYALFRYRQ